VSDPFVEPGDPGDLKGSIRAGDLLNLPCLFRVTGEGEWEAKPAELNDDGSIKQRAQGPRPYVECDVVVLGAGGIEDHASGVRISWTRVVPAQLSMAKVGQWVPARPKQQDDRSIILLGFDDKGKARAAELLPEAEALFADAPVPAAVPDAVPPAPAYADGEEPF
jgi:hypothetical protein